MNGNRIAIIGIIIEKSESVEKVNALSNRWCFKQGAMRVEVVEETDEKNSNIRQGRYRQVNNLL